MVFMKRTFCLTFTPLLLLLLSFLGFIGVECDQWNYCLNHTCADFAECKSTRTSFECWFNGESGKHLRTI